MSMYTEKTASSLARDIDDDQARAEIIRFIGDNPGAGESEIAGGLGLRLRRVCDLLRQLEAEGELRWGEA